MSDINWTKTGIYYYVVTDDFPYFSRCLKGDF